MTLADFIPAWASAIAQFEGFNTPGTVAARNFNPGNLKFAGQPGAVGQDSRGFAKFPDASTGFQALYLQLQKYVTDFPGYSLLDIMAHYLGQASPTSNSQGSAFNYAAFVASQLQVAPSITLAELAGLVAPSSDPPGAPTDATSVSSELPSPNGSDATGLLLAVGLAVGAWLMIRAWA